MDNVARQIYIKTILDQMVKDQKVFTVFDVTTEARKQTDDNIRHSEVKQIVEHAFINSEDMPEYCRRLCILDLLSDTPQAFVYFPDTKSESDHPLICSKNVMTIINDSTDSSDDDEDIMQDGEIELTAEGRINIPTSLLSKVSLVSNTYDIIANGTLICASPNKDGRVRINLKSRGFFNKKVKVSVDTNNNTIYIENV